MSGYLDSTTKINLKWSLPIVEDKSIINTCNKKSYLKIHYLELFNFVKVPFYSKGLKKKNPTKSFQGPFYEEEKIVL